MNYFDNGATTFPKPQSVIMAIDRAVKVYGANPGRGGHPLAIKTAEMIFRTRQGAATFFGAGGVEDVVFTQNCTHSVNTVLKGLLKKGDHVILSDLEHNAVVRPLYKMEKQEIISCDIAATFADTEQTVQSFASLLRPNTKLVVCTHGSNVFGIVLPIKEIAALCRKKGILFMVDAAQTAGILPIHMENQIDFLCVPGHKSLYGPSGTGMLITPYGEILDTFMEGGTGSVSIELEQPGFMPDRFESGTINVVGIIGLGAGIEFINRKGINTLYNHEMKLAQGLYRELSKIKGVHLYTSRPQNGIHLPVISFNTLDRLGEETAVLLGEAGFALRGGLHCAPVAHKKMGTYNRGTARISLGAFNTENEAVGLVRAIHKIAKQK